MTKHEKYRKIVAELNTLKMDMDGRVKRCTYLKVRRDAYDICNSEQAEAYSIRLEHNKLKLIEMLEKVEQLENELSQTPRTWIV